MNDSSINSKNVRVSISDRLDQLVGNKLHSDLEFLIEDDNFEIPAHKLIVAAASPVFDRMIYGTETFSPTDVVKVDGISKDAFFQILRFIYTDKISINEGNVFEILYKSNYYGLQDIEAGCLDFLDKCLNVFTVVWIYHHLFHLYSKSELLNKCVQYIRIQPLVAFASDYFEKISVDEMKSILRMDGINCSEAELFEALITLSKAHCVAQGVDVTTANQRRILNDAEKLLRLDSLSDFDNCLKIQNDFYSTSEIEQIRACIRSTGRPAMTRKQYTYNDAVWIEISDRDELPPSAFCCEYNNFVYRSINDGEVLVAGSLNEIDGPKIEVLCGSGFAWRKCINGMIPPDTVSATPKKHSTPVFIGKGQSHRRGFCISTSYMNGKMIVRPYPQSSRCLDFFDGDEEMTEFEILVAVNVKHPYSGGGVPSDAILIARDKNGYDTYLGRAWIDDNLLPAEIVCDTAAFVAYGSTVIQVQEYDFVRMDPDTYEWVSKSDETVPENSVIAGGMSRTTLYFGRVMYKGNYIAGRIEPYKMLLHVSYLGREMIFRTYEVLVHKDSQTGM